MVFEISRISGITSFYNQLMSSKNFPCLFLIHISRNGLGIQCNEMKCNVAKRFFFETLFEYDKTTLSFWKVQKYFQNKKSSLHHCVLSFLLSLFPSSPKNACKSCPINLSFATKTQKKLFSNVILESHESFKVQKGWFLTFRYQDTRKKSWSEAGARILEHEVYGMRGTRGVVHWHSDWQWSVRVLLAKARLCAVALAFVFSEGCAAPMCWFATAHTVCRQ